MVNYENRTKPSPEDKRDWIAESILPAKNEVKTPKTLDLRKDMQPVRSQGSQGSCAAMTAAAVKEYQEKLDVDLDQYMSPQYVYNNRSNYPKSGMYGRDVMKILTEKGCCLEQDYEYMTIEAPEEIDPVIHKKAKNYVIKSYARVTTIDGLKVALYTNGACYISFPTYNSGMSFWKPEKEGQTRRGGHAVTVVGYNKEGFIIRNSWGKRWGDNGHTIYPYTDFGMHWEIWSTVDSKSPIIPTPKPDPKCCSIL